MSEYTEQSRQLARDLPPGEHAFYNDALRDFYGFGRITVQIRTVLAEELERAGLQIVSDPQHEPLVVRKVAHAPVVAAAPRPWWKRGWAIGVGAVLILLLLVGVASGPDDGDEPKRPESTPTQTESTTTEETPAETLADAQEAVDRDDYAGAMEIAAALGDDEENHIARRISRRIGRRALRALAKGDRGKARRLLRQAEEYPRTSVLQKAESRYDVAVARAKERAEAKRQARREARAQARAEERARREAEEAAQAPDPAPSDDGGSSAPESGPSTTNWCGKRDGDGDGIYCEGE
jgi:hypothetical protein